MTRGQRGLGDFATASEDGAPPHQELLELYDARRAEIEARMEDFARVWWKASDEDLFAELVFCLCAVQTSAVTCDAAVQALREEDLLLDGTREALMDALRGAGVRFHENKTRWILAARERFMEPVSTLRKELAARSTDPRALRDWLQEEVLGFGLKEASHFLRNVGLADGLAILDRHILANLGRLGVVEAIPRSLTRKRYLEIEAQMEAFCREVGIPPGHMDLLLWARETGFVFK